MKKTLLSLIFVFSFSALTFANTLNINVSKSIKIDDMKFAKGTCTMRLTYTNPQTGQRTSWIETYETATAEECGKLLVRRIQELSSSTSTN